MSEMEERPLVTFALFAYNQEKYIREAVEGAFSQTYSPLEIILSDDCSNDRTFEIMQEMAAEYRGPHRVRVRRSQPNKGLLSHVISVGKEANGDMIVVAAGDDISCRERTEITMKLLDNSGEAYAFSSDDIIINEDGEPTDWDVERISLRKSWHNKLPSWVHGATAAYRTSFISSLPLPKNEIFYEDMIFADLLDVMEKKSIHSSYQLVKYRYHSANLSNRLTADESHDSVDDIAIQRWTRAYDAKAYCLEVAHALLKPTRRHSRIAKLQGELSLLHLKMEI